MHNIQATPKPALLLGALLQSAGMVSAASIEVAMRAQVKGGERLGIILVKQGALDARDAAAAVMVQEGVRVALARQGPAQGPDQAALLLTCLRLGELLLARGEVARQDLDRALLKQSKTAAKLGQLLVTMCSINRHQLAHALSLQKRLLAGLLSLGVALAATEPASAPAACCA